MPSSSSLSVVSSALLLGTLVGLAHFAVVGVLYGNPWIDGLYRRAMETEPGVRRWSSKPKYLLTQFLGTQLEVYALSLAFFWVRSLGAASTGPAVLTAGLVFAALRVYPRFWNMFIQSTYPRRLLAVELVNGVLSTLVVVFGLHLLGA
jgi:hypothetical protein